MFQPFQTDRNSIEAHVAVLPSWGLMRERFLEMRVSDHCSAERILFLAIR